MIRLQVQNNLDGLNYCIDTEDRQQAEKWLLDMALKFGAQSPYMFPVMGVVKAVESND